MAVILYCKNHKVYNIDTEEVYSACLLPGLMKKNPCKETFKLWLKTRYSSNTNSLARRLKGITFGQGNRVLINKSTHILSLSDCYWTKEDDSTLLFEEVSPYYTDFWKGEGYYKDGNSIPTLYVSGYLNKEWVSAKYLNKYGDSLDLEEEVSLLCKKCGIPVCNISKIKGGIQVENFTNRNLMLEQADQSGIIDPDYFTEKDIIDYMGMTGIQMLTIDAITGNGDRHAGNFGWLRNTDDGSYVCPSPLYDFDHVLDSTANNDRLIKDLSLSVKNINNDNMINEVIRICNIVKSSDTREIFRIRSDNIILSLTQK